MRRTTIQGALVLCGVLLSGTAYPASISLDYAVARPGTSVEVAVNVSSEFDIGGVNVRLEYDPAVFSSASVSGAGTLLGAGHSMQFSSPAPGRLDALAWAPAGTGPFTGRSGVVFTMVFDIEQGAAAGDYPIPMTSEGPVILASSGLSDMNGNSIPHTVEPGIVDIRALRTCDVDCDGKIDGADLLKLLQQWHWVSEKPLPAADLNWDTAVDVRDLMIFQADWKTGTTSGKP
jgi:hypothetical protein